METLALERSIWISAPREKVWQAITEPDQIGKWFLPAMPMPMKRDESGTLSLDMGFVEAKFAVLEKLESPRQMTSRSLPDKLLATHYRLDEENGGTRLTVSMTGFERLPADERQDRFQLSGTAWEEALANLNAYIGGKDLPYPQAAVAPLFGFWREAKEMIAIERTVWINATRERVWQAITDPRQVEQWFSPGTTFKSKGTGVGARLYIENPETGAEMYTQITAVYEPPHRLVTKSVPEASEPSYATSYRLDEEDGGTRLTLTYSGYEQAAADIRKKNMEENAFGFGMMLGNVKAFIEGAAMPQPQGF